MKRISTAVLALTAILSSTVSCDKNSSQNDEDHISSIVFTQEIPEENIGIDNATLLGEIADSYQFDNEADEAGFYYGTDPALKDESTQKKQLDSWWGEGDDPSLWKGFKAEISPLKGNTVYYYRSYLIRGKANLHGAIMSFKTKPYKVTAVNVVPPTATIKLAREDKTVQLSVEIIPDEAPVHDVIWSSKNTDIATVDDNGLVSGIAEGQAEIIATSVEDPEIFGKCTVTVLPPPPAGAVDMGLQSGKYWYEKDLGASSPESPGAYFAWAETEARSGNFDVSHYKYGGPESFTKYKGTDYLELSAADDAAKEALGGNWRVPSEYEWLELVSNCSIKKSDNGLLLTANNPGEDGQIHTLFLPFAGYYGGSTINFDETSHAGKEKCFYWTNSYTYYGNYIYANARSFVLYNHSTYGPDKYTLQLRRWYGVRIRPIYRKY